MHAGKESDACRGGERCMPGRRAMHAGKYNDACREEKDMEIRYIIGEYTNASLLYIG